MHLTVFKHRENKEEKKINGVIFFVVFPGAIMNGGKIQFL